MSTLARKLSTIDDLLAFNEENCELIDGQIVRKTAPGPDHGDVQNAIGTEVRRYFRRPGSDDGTGGWWIMTETLVVYNHLRAFQHDLVGWRRARVPEKPTGKKATVRPDWVCEILSGNRKNDLVTKKWELHQSEVPFYWIVDIEEQLLTVLKWSVEGYTSIADVSPGEMSRLEPFSAVELDVSVLFGADPK